LDSSKLNSKLRGDFGDSDDSVDEPEIQNAYGSHGDFQLVGHGLVTNDFCGKYYGLKGCLRTDLHGIVTLDGTNYHNKVFVRVVHHSCNKPSCPVCYKSGWAVREASRIEARLKEASRLFGLAEHIVASVPARDYGLKFETLRAKIQKVLAVRNVVGGVLIFHGFRYNLEKHWYWSPHFHVLGFVLGGYDCCRGCKKGCVGCNGFEGRTRQFYQKDGYIVKVLDKRKTVFGTAWYQLNHASIKKDVRRFHVATWFGVCSYRKLKVSPDIACQRNVCPICHEKLKRVLHLGTRRIITVKGQHGYVDSFVDDSADGDGSPNYCEAFSSRYGSGSYE
jgi:hypothetical protein